MVSWSPIHKTAMGHIKSWLLKSPKQAVLKGRGRVPKQSWYYQPPSDSSVPTTASLTVHTHVLTEWTNIKRGATFKRKLQRSPWCCWEQICFIMFLRRVVTYYATI